MRLAIIFGIVLFAAPTAKSPFNSYDVFLSPRNMPGACSSQDLQTFRNRTYTFRSHLYPGGNPLTLRDGRLVERNLFGTPEWKTSLASAQSIHMGNRLAVLLLITADHVFGTGGVTHVLVAECRNDLLRVLFEASGEGVRDASFSTSQELTVRHWVWSSVDAHCCPSREAEERYRWTRTGRFVRLSRTEREAPK